MPRSFSSGRRPHPLKLQHPPVERSTDGDGNYVGDFSTYAEPFGAVEPATAQRLERTFSSGAIASATHIVTLPFIQGVEVQDRVLYHGRTFTVLGVADPEERHIELVLVCQEIRP